MEFLRLLWFFCAYSTDVEGYTHWLVTEKGLIQPRADSPFEMARSYDLLAFLNQDTRWENIIKLHKDLKRRQVEINMHWRNLQMDTDMNVQLSKDKNCMKAPVLNTLDWFGAHLEEGLIKQIPAEEYQITDPSFGEDVDVPDCKRISSLTFSMFAFEHLEGMMKRQNLSAEAEMVLPEIISPMMTVEQFGHWVANVLRWNSSSWLHYNLASLYWRVRGNAPKALECSRRAVRYAPREYKDIALLSMGTILHRSKHSADAVVVLKAAIDHEPECAQAHFMLANAHAVLGNYNTSLWHYEKTLQLNSAFEPASKNRYGVHCLRTLKKKMKDVSHTVTHLRQALAEYAAKEAFWLKSQASFLRVMKNNEDIDFRNVEKIMMKMSEMINLDIKELKKDGDRNSLIQYFLEGPLYKEQWLEEKGEDLLEAAHSLQKLVRHIAKHAHKASEFVIQPDLVKMTEGQVHKYIRHIPIPEYTAEDFPKFFSSVPLKEDRMESDKPISYEDDMSEFEEGMPLYPPTFKTSRNFEEFDREPEWPSDKLCRQMGPSFPEKLEVIYPIFLPFENKGLSLRGLFSDKIGVALSVEHELPWHPPMCPQEKEGISQKKSQKQNHLKEVMPAEYLRRKLMEYVGDGIAERARHMQDAEIGQRIYTAMQQKVAPKWVIYTVASLYWRVRKNNAHALTCLQAAVKNVRNNYKDLVLTSLASVYIEMGYYEEALQAADEAFKLSLYEPSTNFILSELNMIKKNRNTQMFHLKQVIRVQPDFMGGLARTLLNNWACLLKQVKSLQGIDFREGDICTQVEPGKSMVCEKDGTNCQMTNIQCFTHNEKDSTSTLVRLMRIKDDPVQPDEMDDSVFEPFIANMPLEKSDIVGHQENYDKMLAIVENLKGCGPRGCSNIKPEDLALKEDDCTYQYLQLGYWLHIISFRQLISDSDLRLPPEIATMTPSSKKVPECRVYADPSQDFFLERMSKIPVDGWEPVLSLMHQYAEFFDFFDYITLGAKIAKYIEMKPRSWTGALGAGWWCGSGGRGACAARCLAAAYSLAPQHLRHHVLRSFAALLHMQSKQKEAKEVAYLSFYISPKSKTEAFLVAVSHSYQAEYEQAVWLYRYALTFDEKYLPAKACLHATMCIMLYGDKTKPKDE